jgi:hypothetical protein
VLFVLNPFPVARISPGPERYSGALCLLPGPSFQHWIYPHTSMFQVSNPKQLVKPLSKKPPQEPSVMNVRVHTYVHIDLCVSGCLYLFEYPVIFSGFCCVTQAWVSFL